MLVWKAKEAEKRANEENLEHKINMKMVMVTATEMEHNSIKWDQLKLNGRVKFEL